MSENILRKISGQYIAAALQTLPNVETSKDDFQETIIELPVFGRTRFKCQHMTGRQGKYRYRFWTAMRRLKWIAEKIPLIGRGKGRRSQQLDGVLGEQAQPTAFSDNVLHLATK